MARPLLFLTILFAVVMITIALSPHYEPLTFHRILFQNDSGTFKNYIFHPADATNLYNRSFGAVNINPAMNPIGGGKGYSNIISMNDPRITYIATNTSQFLDILEEAQSGDVVYIPEDVDIDLTGIQYGVTIPSGVTIASNRGYKGSSGGRILQNRDGNDPASGGWNGQCALKTGGDNIRITGIRLEGPDTTTQRLSAIGQTGKIGFNSLHRNIIVDNCEIYGWSMAGIMAGSGADPIYSSHIHHNYIHHCQADGFGYGVLNNGVTLIEANIFDYCRHMIADDGDPAQFYEARYNIFGEHTGNYAQQVDAHPPGGWTNPRPELGTTVYIHHNTFLHTGSDDNIRLHPSYHTSYIDHNVFYRTDAQNCVYVLYGYENIVVEDNMWAVDTFAQYNSTIVRYFDKDWMPIFGRPIEPRPQMLPAMSQFPDADYFNVFSELQKLLIIFQRIPLSIQNIFHSIVS
jgi:hypothetical protein